MPDSLSSTWLLRASDPIYLRTGQGPDGLQSQRMISCSESGPHEWLIVADPDKVLFVCRCGRRQKFAGTELKDVVALVEAETVQESWTDLDTALRALGFPTVAPPAVRRWVVRNPRSPRKVS